MSRFIKLAGGLFLFTLVLASCGFFGQDEQAQVVESTPTAPTPTAIQAPPTATHTAIALNPTVASSPTTATATETPPTAPPTEVPPTPTVTASWTVGNTGGDGVYIRRSADMDDRIKAWPDGTEMVVVGPDVTAEDVIWKNVRDPDENVGFVPAEFLVLPGREGTEANETAAPATGDAPATPSRPLKDDPL